MSIKDTLNKLKSKVFKVEIEDLEEPVFVKRLSAKAALALNNSKEQVKDDDMGAGLLLVINTLCDENGNLIFSESDKDSLLEYPESFLSAVINKSLAVNNMTKESQEEIKKN